MGKTTASERRYLKNWRLAHPNAQKHWRMKNRKRFNTLVNNWRKNNPEKWRQTYRRSLAKKKAFLSSLRKAGCKKCGEKDDRVLDWAHKKPGTKRIPISPWYPMRALLKELPLCVLLCANCHRKKDYAEMKRRSKKNKFLNLQKKSG